MKLWDFVERKVLHKLWVPVWTCRVRWSTSGGNLAWVDVGVHCSPQGEVALPSLLTGQGGSKAVPANTHVTCVWRASVLTDPYFAVVLGEAWLLQERWYQREVKELYIRRYQTLHVQTTMGWVGLEHADARHWYTGKRSDQVQGVLVFQMPSICSRWADSLKSAMSS